MSKLILLGALVLVGCSTYQESPEYAQCVKESPYKVPEWYAIGTVQKEMLRLCTEAKQAKK